MNSNEKKRVQLGMHSGTASHRLRKMVFFDVLSRNSENICFQCGEKILSPDELSIEHKKPWLDSDDPKGLFFSLENVGFSHLRCNSGAARRRRSEHGTRNAYAKGCRCSKCKEGKRVSTKDYRERRVLRTGKDR